MENGRQGGLFDKGVTPRRDRNIDSLELGPASWRKGGGKLGRVSYQRRKGSGSRCALSHRPPCRPQAAGTGETGGLPLRDFGTGPAVPPEQGRTAPLLLWLSLDSVTIIESLHFGWGHRRSDLSCTSGFQPREKARKAKKGIHHGSFLGRRRDSDRRGQAE
jgi:hypothetical protein